MSTLFSRIFVNFNKGKTIQVYSRNSLRRKPIGILYVTDRYYSRNVLRRKAIRVLNTPEDPVAPIKEDFSPNLQLMNEKVNKELEIPSTKQIKLIVPPYEKLQKTDPRFTKLINITKTRHLREKKGVILLEGKRLINDAINANAELLTIYFSREKDLADLNITRASQKVEIFKILYKTLQLWSNLNTCPGVMGVFKKPSVDNIHLLSEPVLPVNVLCDNIRDPGNMGSIIRNAAAAGCENILLLKGCIDPWEPKVLKTGCGGHFRIPIVNNIEWNQISNYFPKQSKIYIADNSADIDELSEEAELINYDECPENLDQDSEEPPEKYVSVNEHNQVIEVDETYNEPTDLEKLGNLNLPCHLYSSVKFKKESIVLYIGGETHGVDPRIIRLACEYGGKRIKIPLENNTDSLNSSFAMTIILYEIKRQLSERYVIQ